MALTLTDHINQYKADIAYNNPAETDSQQAARVARIYSNFLTILDGLSTLDASVGTNLQSSLDALQVSIDATQASVASVQSTVSTVQGTVSSVQTDITEKEQDIVDLENAVAALQAIPPGASAPSPYTLSNLTCGETISADKVVVDISGQLFQFDPANTAHYGRVVGISLQAGTASTNIDVATSGLIVWAGPSLTAGTRYFAGSAGSLVTSTSGLAVIQSVGQAIASNKLLLNFSTNLLTT